MPAPALLAQLAAAPSAAPWSPLALPNLQFWFDATDPSTITASGSPAKVSEWRDKSGVGRHVTQAVGANQPTTGVRTIGGANAILFEGLTLNQRLDSTVSLGLTQSTLFMLLDYDGAGGQTRLAFDGITGGGRHAILTNMGGGNVWSIYQASFAGSAVAPTIGAPYVIHGRYAGGAGSSCNVNGVAGALLNAGAATLQRFRIGGDIGGGAANAWPGAIRELFLCSGLAATADETAAVAYLKAKGGIA